VTAEKPAGTGTEQKPPPATGWKPPDPRGAEKATNDNDLTTGHSKPGDGGDDNAQLEFSRRA
jgi:hypothetical protein